jgi:glycosyltransferase involved in cell wall biosynthesis
MQFENEPLISVVIPYYNEGDLLKRAVASVHNQSYKNIQIIVVDDKSLQSANSILPDGPENILIHRLDANVGGGEARNIGVNLAKGLYVAFLDADDEWLPLKLELQIGLVKKNPKAIIFSSCLLDLNGFRQKAPLDDYKGGDISEYLFKERGMIQTSGLFGYKANFIDTPFANLKRHQDFQVVLELYKKDYEFIQLNEPSYIFYQKYGAHPVSAVFSEEFAKKYEALFTFKGKKAFLTRVVFKSRLINEGIVKAMKFAYANHIIAPCVRLLLRKFVTDFLKKIIWFKKIEGL